MVTVLSFLIGVAVVVAAAGLFIFAGWLIDGRPAKEDGERIVNIPEHGLLGFMFLVIGGLVVVFAVGGAVAIGEAVMGAFTGSRS